VVSHQLFQTSIRIEHVLSAFLEKVIVSNQYPQAFVGGLRNGYRVSKKSRLGGLRQELLTTVFVLAKAKR
jgi:hypothetical protein